MNKNDESEIYDSNENDNNNDNESVEFPSDDEVRDQINGQKRIF